MILHPLNDFFVNHISVKKIYHYNYQYNYNYYHIQIGSIFRRKGVRYIMGICCWTKCCLTTQIIQNIDHIKARWNLLYYSFNVTVKCICWCISVTFWWNRKLFRVLYNSYINLLRVHCKLIFISSWFQVSWRNVYYFPNLFNVI